MLPSLIADANIALSVIRFLRSQDVDVVSAREEGWQRYEDKEILANAHAMHRCRSFKAHLQPKHNVKML